MAPVRKVIERLLNLLAFLLTTSRPVTADEIRRRVAGYGGSSDEAFRRMFERDKDLLRRIGIPLELSEGNGWGIEAGYLIDPDAYRLPDPGLTDEERAALSLASRVVRLGGSPAAPEALLKLGGVGPGGVSEPLGADLGVAADQLGDLFAAVTERRKIEFDYHQRRRILAPYGLAHRRGHWYLVGGAGGGEAAPDGSTSHPDPRVFRVDRMTNLALVGESDAFRRPEGFDLRGTIDAEPWEAGPDATILATVEFDPEIAWWAARMLKLDHPGGQLTVELPVANVDAFVGWILSFDDAAVVTGPPELRRQVVERIQAAMA
ncbi:MAG TPA: WYL domain-containing protein [Acidimicrobiia bacterium]|nr:WYL domain-containing protein [Acidimicrobiia bacterium]